MEILVCQYFSNLILTIYMYRKALINWQKTTFLLSELKGLLMYALQESSVIQNYEGFQLDRSVYCLLNSISGAGNILLSFAYPHLICIHLFITPVSIFG